MIKKLQDLLQGTLLVALFLSVTLSFGQAAPTATAATGVVSNGFTATWGAVATADGYYLDVSESPTFGSGTLASNLIISEYGEGNGGSKKYVEIFNGTGVPVDLSNYRIWRISNGGSWPEYEYSLSGTLADGAAYVIGNNSGDVIGADVYNGIVSQNGDDAIGLAWNGGSGSVFNVIDAVGSDGPDVGQGWTVAGVNNATKDKIIIRKSSVFDPTTDWAASAGTNATDSEWIVSSFTYNSTAQTTNLGSHVFDGGFTPSFVTGYNSLDVGNVTSYNVTDLEPGTTYYFRVRAYSGANTSDNSNVIQVDVPVCGVIDLPVAPAQTLCADVATVASLTVTTGEMPQWYAAETGGTSLASDTALATGVYYVSQTVAGCESLRAAVAVIVNPTPAMPTVEVLEFCGAATVADLTVTTGDMPQWYAAETGGTALATDVVLATGSYYVSQTVDGCESSRVMVSVTINDIPVAPTAEVQMFCGSGTVADLTVTTGEMPQWYIVETGGDALTTDVALATGVYYVSQTVNGCESIRTAVAVTVNDIPVVPTAEAQMFCGSGTVADLTVTTGEMIQWYIAETGGDALTTDVSLVTGDYYVSQTVDGCESTRAAVAITVNPIPAAPTVDAGVQEFCNAATLTDIVTGGDNVLWYATSVGGEVLESDMALTEGTNLYYVSQTIDGCESIERTAVAVVLNITSAPIVEDMTFCGTAAVVDLMVTSGTAIQWYDVETEGAVLTDDTALVTGMYYASQTIEGCESPRAMVNVTINEITAAPIVDSSFDFCGSATIEELSIESGGTPQWYTAETGGEPLTVEVALMTGTYYVSQTVDGCESTRTSFEVTVNAIPSAPTAEAVQAFCNAATLDDIEVDADDSILWYAANEGGDPLSNDTALTEGTTVYYVSQEVNGCESVERTAVAVVLNVNALPVASAQTFCGSATVADLSIEEGEAVQWYAEELGGMALTDETTLATGTYYLSQTLGDCESLRAAVEVTVNVVPMPVGDATQDFTEGQTIADLDATGTDMVWYSDADLTSVIETTTVLEDATTYYVVANDGDCSSEVLAITVTEVLSTTAFVNNTFKFYPNPVNDILNVEFDESITSVIVYNLLGQPVMERITNSDKVQVNMSSLSAGTYIVRAVSGNQTTSFKVLKN
ncbi:MAG: hypothetical protein BM557_04460 [Flavobacterium sp. MedPE-SWcel]|uniref:Ig-like domain-containing protein n=1 Tax=uncultured Flavobacterium sp. TaxID=165435 RepID=UPI00090FEAD1|nr:T9SS type A sorting domain-containing protein [uncultured Flavobacterium sp.]OIQ21019.1 MAG: hypothetical protein BM557_04460 [Flavobacterium sp. MedPE-SWcel]